MANERLAGLVNDSIERLTDMWMRAVRQDQRIDSDEGLTRTQLRDHVPAILEEICELLRANETPDHTNTLEGRVKVFLRMQQGYRGRDLAREVSLLRLILLDYLAVACQSDPEVSLNRFYRAVRIVDLYMDEVLRSAIAAYSESEAG
jgi:hypothetical protein